MTNPTIPELFVGQNEDLSSYSALLTATHIGLRRPTALAETVARADCSLSAISLTSGQTNYTAINLAAGQVVSKATVFVVGAAVTPTHGLCGLYDVNGNRLVQAADTASAAWAANAELQFTFTASYTAPADGVYYLGVSTSAGTPATLAGVSGQAALNLLSPSIAFLDATAVTTTLPTTFTKSSGASAIFGYLS